MTVHSCFRTFGNIRPCSLAQTANGNVDWNTLCFAPNGCLTQANHCHVRCSAFSCRDICFFLDCQLHPYEQQPSLLLHNPLCSAQSVVLKVWCSKFGAVNRQSSRQSVTPWRQSPTSPRPFGHCRVQYCLVPRPPLWPYQAVTWTLSFWASVRTSQTPPVASQSGSAS